MRSCLQVWRKAATTQSTVCAPYTVLITNREKNINELSRVWFILYLQNSIGTIKLLPHCHTLASFPGLPFYLPFAIHGSGLPLLCIIVNANKNGGGLGTRLVILYIYLSFVVSLLSLSYLWTNTCPLLCKSNFSVVINELWPTEKLSSLSVELAGLKVAMKLCTCML